MEEARMRVLQEQPLSVTAFSYYWDLQGPEYMVPINDVIWEYTSVCNATICGIANRLLICSIVFRNKNFFFSKWYLCDEFENWPCLRYCLHWNHRQMYFPDSRNKLIVFEYFREFAIINQQEEMWFFLKFYLLTRTYQLGSDHEIDSNSVFPSGPLTS